MAQEKIKREEKRKTKEPKKMDIIQAHFKQDQVLFRMRLLEMDLLHWLSLGLYKRKEIRQLQKRFDELHEFIMNH